MLTLPIPIFVALVLGFLLMRYITQGGRSCWLVALLLMLASQSVIVALVQHYGVTGLRWVQPVTAGCLPPLAWLTLQNSALRPVTLQCDAAHLLGPAFVGFCVAFVPQAIDVALTVLYLGYGLQMWMALRADLPLARLDAGQLPVLIWRAITLSLIASAVSEILIAVVVGLGQMWLRPLLLSVFSSLILLLIGALSLFAAPDGDQGEVPPPDDDIQRQDGDIMARLDAMLNEGRIYLDPDLSLSRLSRRIGVPAKQVSSAVNRRTGENVSRYINGFRIRHACGRLQAGDSVTSAMLGSGFNTKSNFNREFLRLTKLTPSDWRRQNAASKPG